MEQSGVNPGPAMLLLPLLQVETPPANLICFGKNRLVSNMKRVWSHTSIFTLIHLKD